MFDFIRLSKDKKKLKTLIQNDEVYQNLDEDAYDMVALYTNSTELLELKDQNKEGLEIPEDEQSRDWERKQI